MSKQTKECPSCAMDIPADATVCPICSYEFPSTSRFVKWTAILLLLVLAILTVWRLL